MLDIKMLCEKCKKREATVFYTEVKNNIKKQHHVCEECSKQNSNYIEQPHFSYSLHELLAQFLEIITQQEKVSQKNEKKCDFCNMTYKKFQQDGKFGCAKDYDLFAKFINPLLKRLHGSDTHTGKIPKIYQKTIEYEKKLKRLEKDLKVAIQKENYEQAANIRDQIKKIKGQ